MRVVGLPPLSVVEVGDHRIVTFAGRQPDVRAVTETPNARGRRSQCVEKSPDLLELGIVDSVVEEPPGGAHQDPRGAAKLLDAALSDALAGLLELTPDELVEQRYQRFRKMGAFVA